MIPKSEDRRKYQKRTLSRDPDERPSKKSRTERVPEVVSLEDDSETSLPPPRTAQEANERFIKENITIEKAIYLIFTHIPKLPLSMPASFVKDYAKYVSSGRIGKDYLAEALATQFVDAKVGPGVDVIEEKPEAPKRKRDQEESKKEDERVRFSSMFFYFTSVII